MEDFSILGNAALVPVVIAVTQVAKKVVPKWNPDFVAIGVSMLLCLGFSIYNLTDTVVFSTTLSAFRFVVDASVSGFGTAFAAAKSYDLLYGDKKLALKQEGFETKIQELEAQVSEVPNEQDMEQNKINNKLRQILGE